MRLRTAVITLSTSALLAGSTAALPAGAAPSGCSIRDWGPKDVTVGPGRIGVVKFELDTTCPVEDDVNW